MPLPHLTSAEAKRLADSRQRRAQLRSIPEDVAPGTVRRAVEADIIRIGVTPAPIAGEDRWPEHSVRRGASHVVRPFAAGRVVLRGSA